ncbi:MAG: hypothetical protein MJ025_04315, partial [Victivallaceae bacterium]|nr:hypothetical protein [Victivallaceae bacterium]
MMRRILSLLMLFACAVAFCAAAPAAKKQEAGAPKKLKERFPRSNVRGKNKVFMFNGRRPWVANEAAGPLERAGIRVFLLDGTYLAGLSGAPIRSHMELPEPDPFNGIDKAFEKMVKGGTGECKLVIFNALPPESLTTIFTKERKEKFNKYISNGGNALFTNATPVDTIDDILPFIADSAVASSGEEGTYANLPASKNFSGFPKRIPVYAYRGGAPAKGAEVLSWICTEDGEKQAPFICRKKVGKGTITYFNVCIDHARSMANYNRWLYAQAFTVMLVADCAGFNDIKVDLAKKVLEPIPESRQLDEVEATVAEPVFSTELASVSVSGKTISFANGAKVEINSADGSASFFYPGASKPYIRKYAVPGIMISSKQAAGVDTKTWEFTNTVDAGKKLEIKWSLSGIRADGQTAVATYVDKKGGNELVWIFKSGKFNLDGRVYDGIAHKARLVKSPLLISGLYFDGVLDLPSADFARRFSCYSGPRGYINCYFDKTSPSFKNKRPCDTTIELKDRANGLCWGYSGSGQPFEYVVCRDGLYMSFLESPTCSVAMRKIGNEVRTT